MRFDGLANLFCVALGIRKSDQRIIVGYAPYEFSANAIGKSTHALAPALRSFHLKCQLLVIFRCFAYQLANIKFIHLSAI